MCDNGKNYYECLKQILIERRNLNRSQINAKFPLFVAKFPDMMDVIFRRNIGYKDVVKQKQNALYDDEKTFAQCLYELLAATQEFDATEKRKTAMPDWVAWYENKMNEYPMFYTSFKALMRNICEGRIFHDPTLCMLIVSVEMEHRNAITKEERNTVFNDFVARKGLYKNQIASLKITEAEWNAAIKDFFDKRRDHALVE